MLFKRSLLKAGLLDIYGELKGCKMYEMCLYQISLQHPLLISQFISSESCPHVVLPSDPRAGAAPLQ